MKSPLFSILIYFLLSTTIIAQVLQNNIGINANLISGYSLAPNSIWKTKQSLNGFITGFEIGLCKQTSGIKEWHKTLGKPTVGINLQTIFMNSIDTFGFHISVLPYIQLRLLKLKNSELSSKVSFGGAYASKTFKFTSNFDNRAVSLPLNFAVNIALVYSKKFTQHLNFNTEVGYFHLSNGSFMMPNGGFNIFCLKGGLTYYIHQLPYSSRVDYDLFTKNKKTYYTTYLAGAYREQGTFATRKQFPIFISHHAIMKPINKVYNVGLGADIFYDATQALIDQPDLLVSNVNEADKWLAAIGFCNELTIGKLALPLEFYHYIYNLNVVKQPIYLRFGLTYNAYKKLFFGCYFKGSINKYNTLESDFMEFAIGYKFKKQ